MKATAIKNRFRVISGKLAAISLGNLIAERFGKAHESGKRVVKASDSNSGVGTILKENLRDGLNSVIEALESAGIELPAEAQESFATAYAVAHALQDSGKPAPALVKAAGTVLNHVTSSEQADERVALESFEKALSECAHIDLS